MNKTKIAICTICTNEYFKKYAKLKLSIDNFFLKNHDVSTLVYTDQLSDDNFIFKINHLPSPLITLMKFHFLLQHKEKLKKFDLIYFIDCDCEIVDVINEEIFPSEELPIVVTKHPWQRYNSNSYEDNNISTAYVLDNMNNHYLQGCFFGGYTEIFLNMCESINEMIKIDLNKRYIAKWFDESYLNKFLLDKPKKLLDCGYAYPNTLRWKEHFSVVPKIIHDNNFSA